MFTREDYTSGACTHADYYAQFVTKQTRDAVRRAIGLDRIINSTNPHFNDIPLAEWDRLTTSLPAVSLRTAGDYPTLAGLVCIAKEAARQIKQEA